MVFKFNLINIYTTTLACKSLFFIVRELLIFIFVIYLNDLRIRMVVLERFTFELTVLVVI